MGDSPQQPHNGSDVEIVQTGMDESEAPKVRDHKTGSDKIKGVFSTQSVQKVGTGTTTRKTVQKTFWMCEELDDGAIEIQPLNVNFVPSGPKRKIAKEDLLQKFSAEPEYYISNVFPAMQELNKTIVKGEKHREKGEYFSAENEFSEALKVDVDNVRANFGLGLTYLERGEDKKAENIFERLVKLDAAFEEEHKHLFNEFGIKLRKNRMFSEGLEYYQRAMKLAKVDENLYYNIARCYFELKNIEKTVEHLRIALKMNPNLEPARQFLDWMQEKGMVQGEQLPERTEPQASPEPEQKDQADAPKNGAGGAED